MNRDPSIVERFVESFSKQSELYVYDEYYYAVKDFIINEKTEQGYRKWCPIKVKTHPNMLGAIYKTTKCRFPHTFEDLLLSFRWLEVDLKYITLLSNPNGSDLLGYLNEITKDKFMSKFLISHGFIQFAKAPGGCYDPICFEFLNGEKEDSSRIVRIDHEEILCRERIAIIEEVAKTIQELMEKEIER